MPPLALGACANSAQSPSTMSGSNRWMAPIGTVGWWICNGSGRTVAPSRARRQGQCNICIGTNAAHKPSALKPAHATCAHGVFTQLGRPLHQPQLFAHFRRADHPRAHIFNDGARTFDQLPVFGQFALLPATDCPPTRRARCRPASTAAAT